MSQKRTWLLALMLVAALVFAGCAAPPAAAPADDDGAMAEDSGEMADDRWPTAR
jgi:starvation-inducible outer membrane lipoprotein